MKLQDQVITIEQAKRLKELGIDGDSLFCWNPGYEEPSPVGDFAREWKRAGGKTAWVPAFTVTEMGRMIGSGTFAAQKFHDAVAARINSSHSMTIATAPQFVGNFLIAAIEQEILTPSEANERITN